MTLGIAILIGPATLFIGLPRCRFSLGHGRQARRKNPAKEVEIPREVPTSIAPAKSAAVSAAKPAPSSLDPQVRQDSIAALVTLGFPKRQAQSRVDAVTAGSSAEAVIKAAL